MQRHKILTLWVMLLLVISLTSCSSFKAKPATNKALTTTILPRPTPIEPVPVKIKVLTTKTVMKWVKSAETGAYLYTINEQGYISLAQWLLEIQRYIAEQNSLLDYYEKLAKHVEAPA